MSRFVYSKLKENSSLHEKKYNFSRSYTFKEILGLVEEYRKRHGLTIPDSFQDIMEIIEQGNYNRIMSKYQGNGKI